MTTSAELETSTLLSGENDRLNAIMTIKPGAGGTESQDWAEMLLRMYLRWAERKGYRATVIDTDARRRRGNQDRRRCASKAKMPMACFRPKAGVHRLIRISPFDSGRAAAHFVRIHLCDSGN